MHLRLGNKDAFMRESAIARFREVDLLRGVAILMMVLYWKMVSYSFPKCSFEDGTVRRKYVCTSFANLSQFPFSVSPSS